MWLFGRKKQPSFAVWIYGITSSMSRTSRIALILASLATAAPLHAKELDPYQCAALRAELRQITEAQRERSTPYLQDERKRVKDRMWRLKCEEMEPRS
jgi:hypothetical protein